MDPQAKQGIPYVFIVAKYDYSTNRVSVNEDAYVDSKDGPSAPSFSRRGANFYRAQPVLDRRVHILGIGNVGKFIAHSLRGVPHPPPVTLIFHNRQSLRNWEESPKRIQLITDGAIERREGYDAELALSRLRSHGQEIRKETDIGNANSGTSSSGSQPEQFRLPEGESSEPIQSLIVCTKTQKVVQALSAVKHRLYKDSVICFLQNGMGTVEEVNRELFPDPETRPYYMLGINSHGLKGADDKYTAVHAGFGIISLGILPHERDRKDAPYSPTPKFKPHAQHDLSPVKPKNTANPDPFAPSPTRSTSNWTPNQRYLLRTLLRTPVLSATAYSPPDLLQMQLEKLAVNCIINPLTVLLDARNGSILYNYSLTRVMRLLLSEISLVMRSLPELQYIPNLEQRFDPGRLETLVVRAAHRTRDNISSMLADVRAGRQTEINYINGWIVKKGEEQGIRCLMNYMLVHLVQGKGRLLQTELSEDVPFVEAKPGEEEVLIRGEDGSQE
jgi:2-dehydropantoate 2-reductase